MKTDEKIFEECINRMQQLNLDRYCINAFRVGKVWESEGYGALYELDEEEQKIVDEFEKKHKDYKVYHVIHNITDFGELYNLLYVDTYYDEWPLFKDDLKDNMTLAYVYNKSYNECSEFGSICVKPNIGGLVRIF